MRNKVTFLSYCLVPLLIVLTAVSCEKWGSKGEGKRGEGAENSGSVSAAVKDSVVAEVYGEKIMASELDQNIRADLFEFDKRIYKIKKRELDEMIKNRILGQRAKTENMTLASYMKQKVDIQLKVSETEIDQFYTKNKARIHADSPDAKNRIRRYLQQRKKRDFFKKIMSEAKTNNQIKISLAKPESPTFKVSADDDPYLGGNSAPVVIIEFSDFECPFCARSRQTLNKIHATYKDQVKIVFRDFPMNYHPRAVEAAIAAECANDQGKFWDYHDRLYEKQNKLEMADLIQYAGESKLDVNVFKTCLNDVEKKREVEADVADGKRLGVKTTPTFFINGKMYAGVLSFNEMNTIVQQFIAAKSEKSEK